MADGEARFGGYREEPSCGDTGPVTEAEKRAFLWTGGDYLGFFLREGEPAVLRFSIAFPGAFLGDKFPEDLCGGTVVLQVADGPPIRGLLEYVPPDNSAEHRPYPYRVYLETQPAQMLLFSRAFDTVWGTVELPDGVTFFTGASDYRWE
ncbi:hypothetical protein C8N43_0713 [Litoreibacter ponti]|uniref:Uncharacterized protein n=1 Tax=Litoreibacter ponti TaxID=1510457 RepID=A0A2T6BJ18_9RHOB|nr:hypothetical protein [Litoreibacter ponti]PTX56063.1 hypothetical protein C8N43_0713 [Litoreibacter ponti]